MLLDAIAADGDRDELFEVAKRRARYLAGRAGAIAERTPDRTEPAWQAEMAQATLWMEAAECSTLIAEYEDAQQFLRNATVRLLLLRLPLGAALQRVFYPKDDELADQANGVMGVWRDRAEAPAVAVSQSAEVAAGLVESAYDTAQQWAYYALAAGGTDVSRGESAIDTPGVAQRIKSFAAVPVGRFRFPINHYSALADATGASVRFESVGDHNQRILVDVIAKSLVSVFRSLQWSQSNRYLWMRLLAPAPLFDLDTAMLINRGLQASTSYSALTDAVREAVSEEARAFADEFIEAAGNIAPKPEGSYVNT